jgi:hypothetical protein
MLSSEKTAATYRIDQEILDALTNVHSHQTLRAAERSNAAGRLSDVDPVVGQKSELSAPFLSAQATKGSDNVGPPSVTNSRRERSLALTLIVLIWSGTQNDGVDFTCRGFLSFSPIGFKPTLYVRLFARAYQKMSLSLSRSTMLCRRSTTACPTLSSCLP